MRDDGPSGRVMLGLASLAMHVLMTQVLITVIRVTASYRAVELGASALWIGVIGASYALLQLILATRAGRAIDQFGSRPPLILSGLGFVGGMAIFVAMGQHVWGLILGSMVIGFAHLLCQLAHQARIAAMTDSGNLDRRFAHYMMLISVGQMVGPMAIVVFGGAQNIPDTVSLMVLCAALAVGCLLVAFVIQCPPPRVIGPAEVRTGTLEVLRRPGVVPAIAACTAVVCAIDLLILYLPVIGAQMGVPSATVAMMLTTRAVAALAIRAVTGPLMRVIGRTWLISGSVALSGVGLAMLGFSAVQPVVAMAASAILIGLGTGLALPLTLAWLSNIVPGHVRGLAFALRLSGNRLAQIAVPSLFGAVVGWVALSTGMVAVGALIVGMAVHAHRAQVQRTAAEHRG